jgi:hypothetical protein
MKVLGNLQEFGGIFRRNTLAGGKQVFKDLNQ